MSKNLNKFALLTTDQLSAVLSSVGHPVDGEKRELVLRVDALVDNGLLSFDEVMSVALSTVPAPIKTGIDADVRQQIVENNTKVHAALHDVQNVQTAVNRVRDSVENKLAEVESTFKRLESTLTSKVASLAAPDTSRISSEIQETVSRMFDEFRKETPRQRLEEIASETPVFQTNRAGDIFPVTTYDGIDFSDLQVGIWNDPDAPEVLDDYVFNPAHLHQALIALDDPLPDNVWLAGERGTGKTEFVTQLAARLKRRLFRVNFDEALERADFIGGNSIESGNVVWKPGIITQAVQTPGAMILLDEIGFARAQSLAALHALCERSVHRPLTVSETGQRIKVSPHVVFFGADNSNGHGDHSGNFAGVREQNTAFLDRFSFTLRFDYLPQDEETDLIVKRTGLSRPATENLVQFVNVAREKARAGVLTQPPSLRQLFAWARAVKKGLPVETAFRNAIVNKFPADCAPELEAIYTTHIRADFIKANI